MTNKPLLLTSVKWLALVAPKTVVLDPDGWDRTRYQYSFHEEAITEEEFMLRLSNSTTMQIWGCMKADIDLLSKSTIEDSIATIRNEALSLRLNELDEAAVVFLSRGAYQCMITLLFTGYSAPSKCYNNDEQGCRYARWLGVKFIELPVEQEDEYSNNVYFDNSYKDVMMSWSKCDCTNCNFKSSVGIEYPCMKEILPPSSIGTPIPVCKPPKQEPLSEYKALKKMLEHFKEKNGSLQIETKGVCGNSHLTTIDVQELKDYMLTILEKEMNL